MKRVIIVLFLPLFLIVVPQISAQSGNNKFGIHLAQPHDQDIEKAKELVNSNGGEWGYITLVLQENDRDQNKWQGVFDKLRERKLIPIIRLATQPEGSNWKRPKKSDADSWVQFLNKLNWVTQDRYIILFNEPNHATEWGGVVDPVNFAQVNEEFAKKLKAANPDFYVMMGGLDASAPSQLPNYEDAGVFYEKAVEEIGVDDFNRYFDGLSSHSYPNPGFVGSPTDRGKGTVRTYEWELSLLRSLGVKEMPVFITETGWHGGALSREQVADNFRIAYETVWLPDNRVKAITPFILNYQGEPFLQFSWLRPGGTEVYPEYEEVKSMSKQKGTPTIKQDGLFYLDLPKEITEQSTYHLQFELENTGQAIWESGEYEVKLERLDNTKYIISSVGKVKPFDKRFFDVYITTGQNIGRNETKFTLYKGEQAVLSSQPWTFEVVAFPSLDFKVGLAPKFSANGEDFEVQLFDEYEQLVFKKKNIKVQSGRGNIETIENIALGRKYRIVILKKNYLPRQTFVRFNREGNEVLFESMTPLDFSGDGALQWDDLGSFFQKPDLWGNLQPF